MGKENVILSFLKEQKVDYIYDSKEQIIHFPCFECFDEVEMCTNTTNWKCSKCYNKGNILTLVRYFSKGHLLKARVYNPKREKMKINLIIQNLIKQSPEMKDKLSNIEFKINELLKYYAKKTS